MNSNNKQVKFDGRLEEEWPGIRPQKWNRNRKLIRLTDNNPFDSERIIHGNVRRHFSAQTSQETMFSAGLKLFTDIKYRTNIEEKPKGIKTLNQIFTENKIYFEKKHFDSKVGYEKIPQTFYIKTFYPNGNSISSKQLSLEQNMQRKNRIFDKEEFSGNGVSELRSVKNPEYYSDFFKEGGLVTGSTNAFNLKRNSSKKSNNFYDTMNLTANTLDSNKLWSNKVKKEKFDYDNMFVKTLFDWDNKNLKLKELKKIEGAIVYKKGGLPNISLKRDNNKPGLKTDKR